MGKTVKHLLVTLEKQWVIRARGLSMGSMLVWVACYHRGRATLAGMLDWMSGGGSVPA